MAAPGIPVSPISDAVKPYISVLNSDTAEFNSVSPSLLSPQVAAQLAPVLPYSVIIKNISDQPLRGIHVQFAHLTPSEPPNNNFHSVVTIYLRPGQPAILPGAYRIFTPSDVLTSAAQKGRLDLPPAVSVSSILADLESTPLTVSVEWVIDANGHLFGPDRYNTAARVQAEQQGRLALAKSLTSSPNTMTTLQAMANTQPGPAISLFDQDWYNKRIRADANQLLRDLDARVPNAVQSYVLRVNSEVIITKP